MFKIEVTKADSSVEGFYWMNKHADDFAQFLPSQLTRQLGELITKDNISIIKIDEASKDLLEGKCCMEHCAIDCSELGKIKVIKTVPAVMETQGAGTEEDPHVEVEVSPEVVTTELELTGTAIVWPYSEAGEFQGNN